MANSAGMLKESIWRDPDWRRLPRSAQATYSQLLSQKELDRAGILPLQVSKWAKGCDELTEATLWDDLKLLEARRFVFVDGDADELLIRSYMRHSEVTKYPQFMKAALRCAAMISSPKLRHEIAVELRKLRRAEATNLADAIDPGETVFEPCENPSNTVSEPFENPSITVNPSRTVPEPSGVGERVGEVTYVGGSVGETRAREAEHADTEPPESGDVPPPPTCPKHPNGTIDDCRACGAYRRRRDQFFAERAALAAQRRARFRAAIAACPDCDDNGWIDGDAGRVTRCPKHDWETANA